MAKETQEATAEREAIQKIVKERIWAAQKNQTLGSGQSRIKQRVRENEASEILGLIRQRGKT